MTDAETRNEQMRFTLQIELGNEAMMTIYDVACALRKTADKLDGLPADALPKELDPFDRSGNIRDENGNTVGSWKFGR